MVANFARVSTKCINLNIVRNILLVEIDAIEIRLHRD